MMDFEQALKNIIKAMDLLEEIPDDLYPMVDDDITRAFNILDDVHSSLKSAVEWQQELGFERR